MRVPVVRTNGLDPASIGDICVQIIPIEPTQGPQSAPGFVEEDAVILVFGIGRNLEVSKLLQCLPFSCDIGDLQRLIARLIYSPFG